MTSTGFGGGGGLVNISATSDVIINGGITTSDLSLSPLSSGGNIMLTSMSGILTVQGFITASGVNGGSLTATADGSATFMQPLNSTATFGNGGAVSVISTTGTITMNDIIVRSTMGMGGTIFLKPFQGVHLPQYGPIVFIGTTYDARGPTFPFSYPSFSIRLILNPTLMMVGTYWVWAEPKGRL
jgi:hypothetical protein